MRLARPLLISALAACGSPPAVQPQPCSNAPTLALDAGATAAAKPAGPVLRIVLHPKPGNPPKLSVELAVTATVDLRMLRIASIRPELLENVAAEDAKGKIAAEVAPSAPGVVVKLARAPESPLKLSYDVRASDNVRAPTSDLVVAEDRFRGFGESTILMPVALEDAPVEITLGIDGSALHAPDAASSFGLGPLRTRVARGRALMRSAFVSGAMGKAAFDTGMEHDETSWLGYTAFDPRPAAAEIALVRGSLRELFKGGGEDSFGVLFISSARPAGTYAMVPRASSLVVHLGPGEAWSAALRVGVAQHLVNPWIGGDLRIAGDPVWFMDGVARFAAANVLFDLALMTPDDAKGFVEGLLSVQATSPHRGKSGAELATLARSDPRARAQLIAAGALHAVRVSALIRAKTKGTRSLRNVLVDFVQRGREARAPLAESVWTDMLAKEVGPDEAKAFDQTIVKGGEIALPDGALGPCFRAEKGDYVAFELGFDALATAESTARTIVDLDPKGPAAKAGLLSSDVLDDANFKIGHADTPAKLVVLRNGTKTEISYKPAGIRRPGQVWTRIAAKKDEVCDTVL